MSRHPRRYLSPATSVPIPAVRYYVHEDAEFSDGELETQFTWADGFCESRTAPSELQTNMMPGTGPDVTELYRRKTEEHFVIPQEVVMTEEPRYYYRPAALARLPQRRLPVGVTPSSAAMAGVAMAMQNPEAYYQHTPLEESHLEQQAQYESFFRNQSHLRRLLEGRDASSTSPGVLRSQMLAEVSPQVNGITRDIQPPMKAPVSVRTPRFVRRNIYKRPSALCLQLPHMPDPSFRSIKTRLPTTLPFTVPPLALRREHSSTIPYSTGESPVTMAARQKMLERAKTNVLVRGKVGLSTREYRNEDLGNQTARSAPPMINEDKIVDAGELNRVQKMILERRGINHDYGDDCISEQDSPDQNHMVGDKCSELELLLNQYEQIFSEVGPDIEVSASKTRTTTAESRRSSKKSRAKRRASYGKLTGLMKPRLPPSLKASQQKQSTHSKNSLKPEPLSSAEEDRLEIEQMTSEVLDNLLQDLNISGFTTKVADVAASNPDQETHKDHVTAKRTESEKSIKRKEPCNESRKKSRHCSRKTSKLRSRKSSTHYSTRSSRHASKHRSRKDSLNSSEKGSYTLSRNESRTPSLNSKKDSKHSRKCSRRSSRHSPRVLLNKSKKENYHDAEETSSKVSMKKSQNSFTETRSCHNSSRPFETTFMQDKEKFKDCNSSRTSFVQDKINCDKHSRGCTPFPTEVNGEKIQYNNEEQSPNDHGKNGQSTSTKKEKLEDHTALELHRSKSYIVNLIDRALSRELGTIPEERTSKQYLNLDGRTAMDLIASKNMDADMCMEITQAIADSLRNINNKDSGISSSNENKNSMEQPAYCFKGPESSRNDRNDRNTNHTEELTFSTGNDEPLYIKQLKKLRWGHLKHIQREMRRLEDLERFLDSCNTEK